ncbi:MAG: hypothetical protein M3515_10100, partial [Actinomycetota bacterium]|nr:hypothetical protein [Actinomycetota bacterium]
MSDEAITAERASEEEEGNTAPTSDGRDEEMTSVVEEVEERPELFANREISWVDFNDRVLQLAEDDRVPLLERVKF